MIIRDIIRHAFYEGAVVALGAEPVDEEYEIGLVRLSAIILSLFGSEISTNPTIAAMDARTEKNLTIEEVDTLCLLIGKGDYSISFPTEGIYDGCTIKIVQYGEDNNTMTCKGGVFLINNDFEFTSTFTKGSKPLKYFWFFRSDLATWYPLSELSLDATSPLPPEFDDLLICWLATRLSAVNGADPRQGTLNSLTTGLSKLKARYSSVREMSWELAPHLSRQAFVAYGVNDAKDTFI